ncbi:MULTISPECIES: exonuclease subunit SbcD [unclassified Staphylococcus]|uniref:exonuclease subunit SbcD n=1 Tax=unclassified Staphylococcus TaxID=91994 RepID=UPI0021CFC21A|nr:MULTISPECIES: exonuclease subunit SbcD [unclassified Staphylococcus]UXR73108.1 exonuclease SbcCD subunit D [Staphylococcus sp. IVB6238]UXR75404.1 exonuclease SbcCD subunit D [Staphylococcus sp. IVB6233]UXR79607.1 exonuclease SbcCD subunit D [Staphylococcus sp. IVB6218]
MKIIHTADWHLGKRLNGHSFLDDQRHVLAQFVEQMVLEQPDLIIIAGDIYDTAHPNKSVVTVFEEMVQTLNLEMSIPIVIINGNHDSKERLGYGASWFNHSQLYIRTTLSSFFEPIVFDDIAIYTLPFFTVSEARVFLESDVKTYEQAIKSFVELIKPQLDLQKKNLLVGHFTLNGAPKSDSERDLTIGTIESVSSTYLACFDGVLLGHIHHPFAIDYDHIFYSGSLLQYSFSEVKQAKGYRTIEFVDGQMKQTFKPLKSQHELEVVKGKYEDIMNGHFERKSDESYFHFKLTEMQHVTEPMQKLKQLYPNTLALTPEVFVISDEQRHTGEIKQLEPLEIIDSFYQMHTEQSLSDIQREQLEKLISEQRGM